MLNKKNIFLFSVLFLFLISSVFGAKINYWRDELNTSNIYFSIPNFNGSLNFYIKSTNGYYGNLSAVSCLGDDFTNNASFSAYWQKPTSGAIEYPCSKEFSKLWCNSTSPSDSSGIVGLLNITSRCGTNIEIKSTFKTSSVTPVTYLWSNSIDFTGSLSQQMITNAGNLQYYTGSAYTTLTALASNQYYTTVLKNFRTDATKTYWDYYLNSTKYSGLSVTVKGLYYLYFGHSSGSVSKMQTRYVYINKNLSTKPTITKTYVNSTHFLITVANPSGVNLEKYMFNISGINLTGKLNITSISLANYSIRAISTYDSSSINSFSVKIQNGATINNYYNNTGIISKIKYTDKNKYNITFYNWSGFNRTYYNYNFSSSGSLIGSLISTDITFYIRFHDTNHLVNFTTINITDINRTKLFQTTNAILHFYPLAKNIKFNFKDDNNIFLPINYSFSFIARQNQTFNITVNDSENKIRFIDLSNGSAIKNAQITITYPDASTLIKITNSTGWINFSSNYNNDFQFGNYKFNFSKSGYTNIILTKNLNHSNIPYVYTYSIARTHLKINIFYRSTGATFNKNATLIIFGLLNKTTSTGSFDIVNVSIIAGTYTVQVKSNNYYTEQQVLIYNSQKNLTSNFYLLNLSDPNFGTMFVTTQDSFSRTLSNVKVNLLEYNTLSKDFISISECYTNSNGECPFAIELNVKTYIATATVTQSGNIYTASTSDAGEIIRTDNEVRILTLIYSETFNIMSNNNLILGITQTFINNISNILVQYYTLDGTAQQVCIKYYKINSGTKTQVQQNCAYSSASIQNLNVNYLLNRSNEYKAKVSTTYAGINTIMATYIYPSVTSLEYLFAQKNLIPWFILFIWVVILSISIGLKSIVLFGFLGLLLSIGETLIFPNYLSITIGVFKAIMCGLLLWIARRQQGQE